MKEKNQYVSPEVEVINIETTQLCAGSNGSYVEINPNETATPAARDAGQWSDFGSSASKGASVWDN
jgi:hypothetical protein